MNAAGSILATPKRAWNDAGYRAGLAGASIGEVRELAAQADADGGETLREQVWVGFRAGRAKREAAAR